MVPPGDERFILANLAPQADWSTGSVYAYIAFDTDDCTQAEVAIFTHAVIEPALPDYDDAPNITGLSNRLTFLGVWPGQSVVDELQVLNAGGAPLTFSIASSSPWFSVEPGAATLAPRARQRLLVTFAPPQDAAPGIHSATLTVTHDDPHEGPRTVALQGEVLLSDYRPVGVEGLAPGTALHGIDAFATTTMGGPSTIGVAVAGGAPGVLASTRDSAMTWSLESQPGWPSLRDVDLAGDDFGLAVGGGLLLETTDGGLTWNPSPSPVVAPLEALALVSPEAPGGVVTGWLVGDGGTILRTVNSAADWIAQTCAGALAFKDVDAVDSLHAWVVGEEGHVCRTSDGGATWQHAIVAPGRTVRGVDFVGTAHGLAVGDGGVILRTEDGGATWTTIAHDNVFVFDGDPTRALNDVILLEAYGRAWAVGEEGMILFSYDGGRTWTQHRTGLDGDLTAIVHDGRADGNLWISGNPGIVLRRFHVPP